VTFASKKINDDPYPVILCVTDNTSALNWTLHTSKKSNIGRALARFFCGLLIGSNVGVNAKWISTIENVIADKISRLKVLIWEILLTQKCPDLNLILSLKPQDLGKLSI